MELHVDESGNLGKKDRFFVIVSVHFLNKKRIKNFLKRYTQKRNIAEAKGQVMNFKDRQYLLKKLSTKDDHFISYIVLDKQNLTKRKLFDDKNILFNYLCSFLFRRTIKNCQESISISFDNRTVKVASGNSLKEYLKIKAYAEWNFLNNLNIYHFDSKSNYCIQMADIISNTIFRKYNNEKDHFYNLLKIRESIRFPQNTFGED